MLDDKLEVGVGLQKTVLNAGGDESLEVAVALSTRAEAEEGINNTTLMTPLRVQQSLEAKSFSYGQSWVDETANRALGSSYQNVSDRAIFVAMDIAGNVSSLPSTYALEVSIDNSNWMRICTGDVGDYNNSAGCSGLVPSGSYYRYVKINGPNSVTSLLFWSEFK